MEHILKDGEIRFDAYLRYLRTVEALLPRHVAEFAADERHYSLDDRESLHDAWLETVTVAEPSSGARHEIRDTTLELRFLGAYHDRIHVLRYRDVRSYELHGIGVGSGHGDVYTHETRLAGDGRGVVHEYAFSGTPGQGGSRIRIECSEFVHEMQPLAARAG